MYVFFCAAVAILCTNLYQLDITTVIALFCSKEGAAQVRLKLGVVGDDQGHNFTFTAPPPAAIQDREVFKRELSSIISRNRGALEKPTGLPGVSTPFSGPSTPLHGSFPRPSQPLSRGSTPSSIPPPPGLVGNPEEFRLRKQVLLKTPELAALHRELVMGGQITEAEFWDGREVTKLTFVCLGYPSDADCNKSTFYWRRYPSNVRKKENLGRSSTRALRTNRTARGRLWSLPRWSTTSSKSTL